MNDVLRHKLIARHKRGETVEIDGQTFSHCVFCGHDTWCPTHKFTDGEQICSSCNELVTNHRPKGWGRDEYLSHHIKRGSELTYCVGCEKCLLEKSSTVRLAEKMQGGMMCLTCSRKKLRSSKK